MEKFSSLKEENKIGLFVLLIILTLSVGTALYQRIVYTYVNAEFKELRPIHERLDVYYKGFKVGHARKIIPSKNYKSTIIKLVLYPDNLKLPNNTTVKLKKEKRKDKMVDYLDLIYPETPSKIHLKDGNVIAGTATVDLESYLASQDAESIDEMKQNLADTITTLQGTLDLLGQLFSSMNDIVKENRPHIKAATQNLEKTTQNIKIMSEKLNNSIEQDSLNDSFSNVNLSTTNVRESTKRLHVITQNIDELTQSLNGVMPQITTTLSEAGCIMKNLSEITCGVSKTLQKNFGGMRIIFGKTIDEECTCGSDHK